jgi:lysozyme
MITESTLNFIKEVEGVEHKVYKDSAGLDTIGVGHLLKPGENFTEITDKEVDALLFIDLNTAMNAVLRNVRVQLNQNQFDALVSFVFNVGTRAFFNSTLLVKINQKASRELIVKHWMEWNKAGGKVVAGLVNRRSKEVQLYFKK